MRRAGIARRRTFASAGAGNVSIVSWAGIMSVTAHRLLKAAYPTGAVIAVFSPTRCCATGAAMAVFPCDRFAPDLSLPCVHRQNSMSA